MVVINQKVFDRLDPALQQAVTEAAAKAEARGWEASKAETDAKIAVMDENGIEIVQPSAALKQGLAKIGTAMTEEWREKAGADGAAILEAYKN